MEDGAHIGCGRPKDERHAAVAASGVRIAAAVAAKEFALPAHLMKEVRRLAVLGVEENWPGDVRKALPVR